MARTAREAEALRGLAGRVPEVERPIVLQGDLDELPELLAARGDAEVRFDAIVGRNAFVHHPDKPAALRRIAALLRPGGRLCLAEAIPRRAQRLYRLVPLDQLGSDLAEQVVQAEEAVYADPDDPMVNWDTPDLEAALKAAGLGDIRLEVVEQPVEVHITPALIERWFEPAATGRPSYGQRLAARLTDDQLDQVRALFERHLVGRTVDWTSRIAYVQAWKGDGT